MSMPGTICSNSHARLGSVPPKFAATIIDRSFHISQAASTSPRMSVNSSRPIQARGMSVNAPSLKCSICLSIPTLASQVKQASGQADTCLSTQVPTSTSNPHPHSSPCPCPCHAMSTSALFCKSSRWSGLAATLTHCRRLLFSLFPYLRIPFHPSNITP